MILANKKTKIIATIGPAAECEVSIAQMIKLGVNVFRFNMKHGTLDWHQQTIRRVQKVADELDTPVGILIDLQGPEIRINTKNSESIPLKKGQKLHFCQAFKDPEDQVCVPHEAFFEALEPKDKFSIEDGFLNFEVVKCNGKHGLVAKSLDDGVLKDRKSLNLVGKDINLPSLIEEDLERLSLATKERVDFVALSFSRTKEDIQTLRAEMQKRKIEAQIVAKIESQKALDNLDELIAAADVIMVARGDLGIEVPIEEITYHQKQMINKCRLAYKPVIVATQMLQSMIDHPLPTRAEATDVANAVFDGTDAVMLSGETATGKYPIRSVEAMARILAFNEKKAVVPEFDIMPQSPTELVVQAAYKMARVSWNIEINHVVVFTETGYTARVLASYRSNVPVVVTTPNDKTVETLTISYGVFPTKVSFPSSGKIGSPEIILKQLKSKKFVKKGENVLLIHGQHWRTPGQTNAIVLMKVE